VKIALNIEKEVIVAKCRKWWITTIVATTLLLKRGCPDVVVFDAARKGAKESAVIV